MDTEQIERLDKDVQLALVKARALAESQGDECVEAEHLLLTLLDGQGLASSMLAQLDHRPAELRALVQRALDRLRHAGHRRMGPQMGPSLRKLIELADNEARAACAQTIRSEHLLLALTHPRQGGITSLLLSRGITRERVLTALDTMPLPPTPAAPAPASEETAEQVRDLWDDALPIAEEPKATDPDPLRGARRTG